ncbi:aminoglycoside phosphotransferase family protein [Deinococcus cellulosilyticus]|uniref:Streptomycin 6-kinase n=1 Tax=Deinococcus cellulosilyticus (strain DSM 18568 / NBRC 106333 / KACC 11606 / 5516J-15) TaxID=1223518 RepID=A0A511N7S9_DEIC1|nr:aminoglycoside phosphotransferase family protein [Deinococcus cellulosilyticus]GEM48471.1 streptomycin 6-kinase [Deinococcus cellulosilyticus NBRC 106333 = KACC 11606]
MNPEFLANIKLYFEEGETWLQTLPTLLEHFAAEWNLELGEPFENLSFNYVTRAKRNGQDVVLKLGVPRDELRSEIAALRLYGGVGSVRLLEADADQGALLIERLFPGQMLSILPEDQTVRVMCEVMQKIWHPVPENSSFPSVADWHEGLAEFPRSGTGIPAEVLDLAESFYQEMQETAEAPVVLHGDLHHFNVLSAGEGWLAIDPKGITGERTYEIGAFLRNPWPALYETYTPEELREVQRKRVEQFAQHLGLSRERILKWGYYIFVLSAVWGYSETSDNWKKELLGASILKDLL